MSHKLLLRQLKSLKLDVTECPTDLETWRSLVSKVSRVYSEFDDYRYLMDLSIGVSGTELKEKWKGEVSLLESRWQSLAEISSDLIVIADPLLNILSINTTPQLKSKDDHVGKKILDIFSDRNREKIGHLIETAMASQTQSAGEIVEFLGETDSWYLIRINPMVKDSTIIGIILLQTDITEIKKAAKEGAARVKAEELAQAKSYYLSLISHEIRTPLGGIIGLVDSLVSETTVSESLRKLRLIQSSCELLLSLLNDTLDLSKMESGKMMLEMLPMNTRNCINEVLELLSTKALDKNLYLKTVMDSTVPNWIVADPTRIRQVLFNLIGNALKFTEKGGVTVEVNVAKSQDGVHKLFISVIDTGMGIPQGEQENLFKSFSQANKSTSRKFGGTGLGLILSKSFVELMGGHISFTSTEGKGSKFYFSIPVKECKSPEVQAPTPISSIPVMATATPLKILIAEDNLLNQEILIGSFKKLGYFPDAVCNGLEAIKRLEKENYDLLLIDGQMPEMDGITATKAIVQRWPTTKPFIVAVTAATEDQDQKEFLKAGANAFIAKPVRLRDLTGLLKKFNQAA